MNTQCYNVHRLYVDHTYNNAALYVIVVCITEKGNSLYIMDYEEHKNDRKIFMAYDYTPIDSNPDYKKLTVKVLSKNTWTWVEY